MSDATESIVSRPPGRFRRFAFKFGIACAVSAIALICVEIALRILNIPPTIELPSDLKAYLPDRAKAYESSISGSYPPDFVIPICTKEFQTFNKTDSLGYVGTGAQKPENSDLLVFGDSFAYGYGVSSKKAFSSYLGAYNAGLWGTSFSQHVLALKRAVPHVRPKVAIWVVYPSHLISASSSGWNTRLWIDEKRNPCSSWIAGVYNTTKVSDLVLRSSGWGVNRSNYHTLEWSLYDAEDRSLDDGYKVFNKAAEEISNFSRNQGIRLYVLFVPSKTQILIELGKAGKPISYWGIKIDGALPNKRLQDILTSQGITAAQQIDLRDKFTRSDGSWKGFYFPEDGHWNEKGHEYVGKILVESLGVIGPPKQ